MEIIHISTDAVGISSTSSKGDQSKWRIGDKWGKKNTRGYEGQAEVLASLVLAHSTLQEKDYVKYYPCETSCLIAKPPLAVIRGKLQEVTLERLFEANFTSTDPILNDKSLSTSEKFEQIMQQVQNFTGLDVRLDIARLLAFDALILNEDRHTNNILFLYNPFEKSWELAPIFDNGHSLLLCNW